MRQLRRGVTVLGLTLEDFDARAPQFIRDAQGWAGSTTYPEEVADALESGSHW